MHVITVARQAMNTRFEVVLHGDDSIALRAAADQALAEVELLEGQLSIFRPTSEISRVNRWADHEPVRVSPPVFRLLQQARQLSEVTRGAFDPTVGPLLAAWGLVRGEGRIPDPEVLAAARSRVGMGAVELDEQAFTVRFARPGMGLDLGAIGKGYAIDCAVEVLREAGVTDGFIHGGTSSSFALGRPQGADAWGVAVEHPCDTMETRLPPLVRWNLRDESLGVSGIYGKAFRWGERLFGHVLDPRSGQPVEHSWVAAVTSASATESDALSTALITLGSTALAWLPEFFPRCRFLLMPAPDEHARVPIQVVGPLVSV